MAIPESAGLLLYRHGDAGLEVLLVHASGIYNRKAPWGIPKGMPEPGEALEAAARREVLEETGVLAPPALHPLGYIDYLRSRKRIHCWAVAAPKDTIPRCASWEIDAAEFLPMAQARSRIHPDQASFLDRLEAALGSASPPSG